MGSKNRSVLQGWIDIQGLRHHRVVGRVGLAGLAHLLRPGRPEHHQPVDPAVDLRVGVGARGHQPGRSDVEMRDLVLGPVAHHRMLHI
jgi:hypothetical protein